MVFKLGVLLVKSLAKPIAARAKTRAAEAGRLRDIAMSYGQFHHKFETSLMLRLSGHHAKRIKPLTDDKAVDLGASVLSEALIFSVGGTAIAIEYTRKEMVERRKKAQKELKRKEKEAVRKANMSALEAKVERMDMTLRANQETIARLAQELKDLHDFKLALAMTTAES